MKKSIYLKDALEIMKNKNEKGVPIPFHFKTRSFNTQNKSAGRLKTYTGSLMTSGKDKRFLKNPNHWANRTRNIKITDGTIKKVHIIFITEINGLEVLY